MKCMYLSGYYSPVFGTVEFCFATDVFIFQRLISQTRLRSLEKLFGLCGICDDLDETTMFSSATGPPNTRGIGKLGTFDKHLSKTVQDRQTYGVVDVLCRLLNVKMTLT